MSWKLSSREFSILGNIINPPKLESHTTAVTWRHPHRDALLSLKVRKLVSVRSADCCVV